MTPILRAEWLPTGSRRWHPSDVAAGRWAAGCGTPLFLICVLLNLLQWNRLDWWAGMLALGALIVVNAVVLSHILVRSRRDERAFADLGERQDDMAEVRVRLYRRGGLLGEDQGYLWVDGGGTAFQGARLAFRLPGGVGRAYPSGFVADLGEGTLLVADGIGSGVLRVAETGEPGPTTLPPATRDPELRDPNLVWRALLLAALAPLLSWSVTTSVIWALFAVAVLRPVWLDRRARR